MQQRVKTIKKFLVINAETEEKNDVHFLIAAKFYRDVAVEFKLLKSDTSYNDENIVIETELAERYKLENSVFFDISKITSYSNGKVSFEKAFFMDFMSKEVATYGGSILFRVCLIPKNESIEYASGFSVDSIVEFNSKTEAELYYESVI